MPYLTCSDCPLFTSSTNRCKALGLYVSPSGVCAMDDGEKRNIYRHSRKLIVTARGDELEVVSAEACAGGGHIHVIVSDGSAEATYTFAAEDVAAGDEARDAVRAMLKAVKPTAGDRCTITLRRDGAHASDVCSGVARLAAIRIKLSTAR